MIPLYKVNMPKSVLPALKKTLYSGYIAEGKKTKEFEEQFSKWIGNPNVAVVNSGTSALTLALKRCGAAPGKNVVTTPMTCVATNTPIKNLGAKIRYADVNPFTGNIDAYSAKTLIDENTIAIVAVHWGGNPCDLKAIKKAAGRVPIIEDAAHAIGAEYNGEKIGNHSDFVCFSFQAIKHFTTIEGGAIACNRKQADQDAEWFRKMRWFGLDRYEKRSALSGHTNMVEAGFKMNMNDVNSTIGLEQLKSIDSIVKKQARNAEWLKKELNDVVLFPPVLPRTKPSYWFLTVLFDSMDERKRVSDALTANGIENSISHVRNDAYPPTSRKASVFRPRQQYNFIFWACLKHSLRMVAFKQRPAQNSKSNKGGNSK